MFITKSEVARAVLIIISLALIAVVSDPWTWKAHGHQSYGGCKEAWQAPRSAGADHCRDHGWTVGRRLVVSPRAVVRHSRLPHCRNEDGSGQRGACTWNIGTQDGNGRGLAYYQDWQRNVHYVWASSPVNRRWRWVTRGEGDALAEGDSPNATRKRWGQCVIKRTAYRVVCADGLVVR